MKIWPAAFLVLTAGAQQVYLPGDDVTAPKVIERSAPEYTGEARLARLEGTVRLKMIVNDDGTVRDAYVTSPIGLGLDQKAVEAVKVWKFAPGMKDGKMVAVLISMEASFHLLGERNEWHLTRATFDLPKGAIAPMVVTATYPASDTADLTATARVAFDVDEHGVPVHLQVDRISDEQRQAEVLAMAGGWRFEPAMKGGKPFTVHASFDFMRGHVTDKSLQ